MSTSTKTPRSIRQGGPGASHENAKDPLEIKKPPPASDQQPLSTISGGGGEKDSHHAHEAERKGGATRPAAMSREGGSEKEASSGRSVRSTEFPVSRRGLNQESRDHHKHNRPGQTGHKPQQHGPAEQKT